MLITVILIAGEFRINNNAGVVAGMENGYVVLPQTNKIDPAYNGKVVFVNGKADTKEKQQDYWFGVSTEQPALLLERKVEYYQWAENYRLEERKNAKGEIEHVDNYEYKEQWSDFPINAASFRDNKQSKKYKNNVLLRLSDQLWQADSITVGAYTLPYSIKKEISGGIPLPLSGLTEKQLAKAAERIPGEMALSVKKKLLHVKDNVFYFGKNPDKPANGDVRVSYTYIPPTDISFFGKVYDKTFVSIELPSDEGLRTFAMGRKNLSRC